MNYISNKINTEKYNMPDGTGGDGGDGGEKPGTGTGGVGGDGN